MNTMPVPPNIKLIRVYGISDRGAPTEWFPGLEERNEEARRRFKIFVDEKASELTMGRENLSQEQVEAITKEAREYAANRVYGIYCDIAQAEADKETGIIPEMWRLMNEETQKMVQAAQEEELREASRKQIEAQSSP